jgi:hypothetical protein
VIRRTVRAMGAGYPAAPRDARPRTDILPVESGPAVDNELIEIGPDGGVGSPHGARLRARTSTISPLRAGPVP